MRYNAEEHERKVVRRAGGRQAQRRDLVGTACQAACGANGAERNSLLPIASAWSRHDFLVSVRPTC
jgi:hypothetical protein